MAEQQGIGRLEAVIVDVNDLDRAERFWRAVLRWTLASLAAALSGTPGEHSYMPFPA